MTMVWPGWCNHCTWHRLEQTASCSHLDSRVDHAWCRWQLQGQPDSCHTDNTWSAPRGRACLQPSWPCQWCCCCRRCRPWWTWWRLLRDTENTDAGTLLLTLSTLSCHLANNDWEQEPRMQTMFTGTRTEEKKDMNQLIMNILWCLDL